MNQTLVSVIITTYNSAKFVIETLESIKSQTWQNIELVVSDDCSVDNTIEICTHWISQNKDFFANTEIITVPKNTGVSANCNRSIAAIKSDYFKFIAGDDILNPNCIEDNMNFVAENPNARIVFSQINLYQDQFEEKNYITTTPQDFPFNIMDKSFSAQDQYNLLLFSDRIHYTPSFFAHKKTIIDVGGYDENNKLVEDYPMWLKLTKAGISLHYFHKPTVGYRIHSKATNNTGDNVLFKPSVINSYKVRQKYAHPHLPWLAVKQETWGYYVTILFKNIRLTKATTLSRFIYKMATIYLNPFFWMNAVNKRIVHAK